MATETMTTAALPKKCVRWSGVQVLQFKVGYNPCAVPSSGPPVGLVGAPVDDDWHGLSDDPIEIEQEDQKPRFDMHARWIDPRDRAQLLRNEDFEQEDIALMCSVIRVLQYSRKQSRMDEVQACQDKTDASPACPALHLLEDHDCSVALADHPSQVQANAMAVMA